MSFLTGLFSNKSVQDMALGTLKKTMKENGFKFVVIDLMDNGELDIQMYKLEDQPLIISHKQAEQTKQIMQDLQRGKEQAEGIVETMSATLSMVENQRDGLQLILDGIQQSNTLKRDNDNNNQQPGEPDPNRAEKY